MVRLWIVCASAALLTMTAPAPAAAQTLSALLERGPVAQVEYDDQGRFAAVTAIIETDRSPQEMWNVITDFENYPRFMPNVVRSDVREAGPQSRFVQLEVETPGMNSRYTSRYDLDAEKLKMRFSWVEGDFRGTGYSWLIRPRDGGGAVVYYKGAARNFSNLLASLEDARQSLTVGINLMAALNVVRAVRTEADRRAAVRTARAP